mgnify:CR=1 FL=1
MLSCLAGTKEISICPASSQSLNAGSLSPNPEDAKIENHVDTQEGAEVEQGFSRSKIISFTACAVLAMGVGIAYMQRHDGVNSLGFGL